MRKKKKEKIEGEGGSKVEVDETGDMTREITTDEDLKWGKGEKKKRNKRKKKL